jgi:hypothetical protein
MLCKRVIPGAKCRRKQRSDRNCQSYSSLCAFIFGIEAVIVGRQVRGQKHEVHRSLPREKLTKHTKSSRQYGNQNRIRFESRVDAKALRSPFHGIHGNLVNRRAAWKHSADSSVFCLRIRSDSLTFGTCNSSSPWAS